MTNTTDEILIAGGGIGGLAAALALAQRGRRVRVLEKAAEFGEIGYGIQMGPNVARMLERLGLLRMIEAHAFFPEALIFADALDNAEVTRIAVGKFFRERYGYRYLVIHRRDLHGELLAACQQRDEIALETSHGVVGFDTRRGQVIVRCEQGSEIVGAALIGADGLHSPTRAAIVGDGPPRNAGHYVYRGVVPTADVVDHSRIDSMTIWGGPNLHLVQYRLRGGSVMNNVATIVSQRFRHDLPNPGAPDELEETFARCDPGVRDMLRYVSRERHWVLHDRDPVTNWSQGNVTLLGDAAHPTLQYLAQGAQMAIEDAVVLADAVAAHGTDYASAFSAYQGARMNRTARVVLSSRFFGEWFHADGGARELRNALARERDPNQCWEADWLYRGI